MPPVAVDDPVAWSVSMSVTLVHPAKAVERNEMQFDWTKCAIFHIETTNGVVLAVVVVASEMRRLYFDDRLS